MAGLTFHYGDYDHPECEVYPRRISATPIRTGTNLPFGAVYRMEIAGDFIGDLTQAQVNTKIGELELAYGEDYQDCGFKLDGSWTQHYMQTDAANNLTGTAWCGEVGTTSCQRSLRTHVVSRSSLKRRSSLALSC